MVNQETIQLVLSADPDYLVPTYITIYSLMKNCKDSRPIEVHILVPGKLPCSYEIFSYLQKEYNNLSIDIVPVDNCFDGVSINLGHIKIPTMYRLLIPKLFPYIEKCIYLDADLVVEGDIAELYDSNIEGYYIAGVHDYVSENLMDYLPKLPERYVNAGVLLMNLRDIRRDGKDDALVVSGQNNTYKYNDQDAINVVFDGGVNLIPPKYNHTRGLWIKDIRYPRAVYDGRELSEARKKPVIVHFTGRMKPWNCRHCPSKKRWMKYVNMQSKEFYEEFVTPFLEANRDKGNFTFSDNFRYSVQSLLARVNMCGFMKEKYRWMRFRLWRNKSAGEKT